MKTADRIPKFRCRTIRLRHRSRHGHLFDFQLDRAPAFSANPRGTLVHRVRDVVGYLWDGKVRHYAIRHLCGNGYCIAPDMIRDVMMADPPESRLLCSFCHGKAEGMRLPASDELAGRHVHRGILVPTQVCCLDHKRKKP
jgi:hypothetical protein